jgi:hypothetical protein
MLSREEMVEIAKRHGVVRWTILNYEEHLSYREKADEIHGTIYTEGNADSRNIEALGTPAYFQCEEVTRASKIKGRRI